MTKFPIIVIKLFINNFCNVIIFFNYDLLCRQTFLWTQILLIIIFLLQMDIFRQRTVNSREV